MSKNIINSSRQRNDAAKPGDPGIPTYEHRSIRATWYSDQEIAIEITIDLYKVGNLVTMIMPQVVRKMPGINTWMSEWVIPAGWRPSSIVAATFPAVTKHVPIFFGEREYDVDTRALLS